MIPPVTSAGGQDFWSKEAGIAVEVTTFSNGGAIGSAVVGGALDIGGVNVPLARDGAPKRRAAEDRRLGLDLHDKDPDDRDARPQRIAAQ